MSVFPREPSVRSDSGLSLMCSAKGCRESAAWGLKWNNPKLHTPDRRKTWLACPDHRAPLEAFLTVRGFLRETVPVGDLTPET